MHPFPEPPLRRPLLFRRLVVVFGGGPGHIGVLAVGDGERVVRDFIGIVEVISAIGFVVDSGHWRPPHRSGSVRTAGAEGTSGNCEQGGV